MRKVFVLVGAILLFAMAVALSGCEGPTGPRGEAGDSGVEQCFTCHAENTGLLAIEGQYENSVHAIGGNFERSGSSCAGCHTHEGFLERLATGSASDISNPAAIHCFTCHAPHTSGNFNLRTQAPVTFMQGGGVFDMGHGNLCAQCHQARPLSPQVKAAPDSTNITSTRWGPHHGPQSNLLAGSGGYEFADYDYEDSPHTIAATNGCPSCHMATPYGAQAGGHTMRMGYIYHDEEEENLAGCNVEDCHYGALKSFNYAGGQAEIELLLEDLHDALFTRGLIDDEGMVVPGKRTEAEAGAIYNFYFLEEDRSLGVHNTKYARALLESSLEKLGVAAAPTGGFITRSETRRFFR